MIDRGIGEDRKYGSKPKRCERKLSFHGSGLHSVLIRLTFPPWYFPVLLIEPNLRTLMLHCNIAVAA